MNNIISIFTSVLLFLAGIGISVICILAFKSNTVVSAIFLFPGIFLVVLGINVFIKLLRKKGSV